MQWLSTRWRFVREMQHSWPVRLLWWGWVGLSALSTLSLVVPQIRQYVPPWDVWAIGFLFISLVAAIEGGFRQVQMLKGVYDPLKLSVALAALPVYADVEIEILCVTRGLSYLVLTEDVFFLHLKIVSRDDATFRGFKIRLSTEGHSYQGNAIADLSDWILVKERGVPIPYNRWQFTNMGDLSLWKEIQEHGLKSGLHKTGWVAICVKGAHHKLAEELKSAQIYMEPVGNPKLYRSISYKLPKCECEILSSEMKLHRFGV